MESYFFTPLLYLFSIIAVSQSHRFMGCYKENYRQGRLLNGDHSVENFKGTLTPNICKDHCKSKGFAYAGTEFSFDCFCSSERPPFQFFAKLSECDKKCDGDESQSCGGTSRVSVYEIKETQINHVESNYMGCYAEIGENGSALKKKTTAEISEMTPEYCVGYCYSFGFRYSGVQNKQCFCGDDINDKKVSESECNQKCPGNSGLMCGGRERSSVYHTTISDESEAGRYLGCFKDSNLRLLPEHVTALKDSNSPRRCLNICLQLGYKYAGVQVGFECFCGDGRPDAQRKTSDNECMAPCPNSDLEACGDVWRMGIYSTSSTPQQLPAVIVSKTHHFMGCYKENYRQGRLLNGDQLNFVGSLTPMSCINHCRSKGFGYAGLQHAFECFCSSQRPTFRFFSEPSECNENCVGDQSKICGGVSRVSVYDIQENQVNHVQTNYVGCYDNDGNSGPALKSKASLVTEDITPEYCVGYCYSYGYRYAGIQNRRCFCGDEIKGSRTSESECGQECSGNPKLVCGGKEKSSIYHTSISDKSEEGRFLGCYIDSNLRLLPEEVADLKETNSPRRCLNICSQLGYKFAGVQAGIQCFCGNGRPDEQRKTNEKECFASCPNSILRACGDGWRMGIYKTFSQQLTAVIDQQRHVFMGCYKETFGRLLNGDQKNFKGTLTRSICIEHCKSLGFSYAGLQFASECFCSSERPSFKSFADLADCNAKCEGDSSQHCGGTSRISLYDIQENEVNHVQTSYMGCYTDDEEKRPALSSKASSEADYMTPEFCVGFCYSHGYRYAGIQNQQCFCGDVINGKKAGESSCNLHCAGNSKTICGGKGRSSIYHTSIPDESEEGRYLGCYIDSNLRLLPEHVTPLRETNSPRRCLNYCLELGYKYAGVQVGFECFCGNKRPDSKRKTNDKECTASCPNSILRACGDVWRMGIYSTPSQWQLPVVTDSVNIEKTQISTNQQSCRRSKTEAKGKKICEGDLIFHEKFDSWVPGVWKNEIFMPDRPDYEFVVFNNSIQNVYHDYGVLVIKPTIYDDEFVRKGRIRLEKCTGRLYTDECEREGKTFTILPPIQSARISTKESFSFKYGKVTIRARLPAGDWLIPEIWLEPKEHVYGPGYQSGRIKIAHSFGNRNLHYQGENVGSKVLNSGIVMGIDKKIRVKNHQQTLSSNDSWFEDFHNYTLIWTPDNISFQVDNGEIKSLLRSDSGKLYTQVGFDKKGRELWEQGTSLAPFDQEFYISIGVSVGGMTEFPDNCITGKDHIKPWFNLAIKGLVDFWTDRNNWYSTWNNSKFGLHVSDVLVYAL